MFALKVNTMPLVIVTNIKISHVKDGNSENLHSIIDHFASSKKYLIIYPEENQLESLSCFGISYFAYCYYVEMTNIEIFNTSCSNMYSPSGLEFELTESMLYLEGIYIHDIHSSSTKGLALSIQLTLYQLIIKSLNLVNVYNGLNNVIELYKNEDILIDGVNIYFIGSFSLSPFLISNPHIMGLYNFIIHHSTSYTGSGGCLEIRTSSIFSLSTISIHNGTFSSCSAQEAYGGAIYLDWPNPKNNNPKH